MRFCTKARPDLLGLAETKNKIHMVVLRNARAFLSQASANLDQIVKRQFVLDTRPKAKNNTLDRR